MRESVWELMLEKAEWCGWKIKNRKMPVRKIWGYHVLDRTFLPCFSFFFSLFLFFFLVLVPVWGLVGFFYFLSFSYLKLGHRHRKGTDDEGKARQEDEGAVN